MHAQIQPVPAVFYLIFVGAFALTFIFTVCVRFMVAVFHAYQSAGFLSSWREVTPSRAMFHSRVVGFLFSLYWSWVSSMIHPVRI